MKYTNDFKSRVLSVVRDYKIKNDILNGKMDLGDYLKKAAFKGIDSKTVLDCLYINDLKYLEMLAQEQEIIKALYQEWFEFYVMKSVPPLIQKEINEEINQINKESLAEEEYYEEKSDLSSLISQAIPNTDSFYKKIGEELTPEERIYISSLIEKNCDTCANGCCRVEQVDKPIIDCIGWENARIVGEYKVLKLNRKKKITYENK